MRKGRYGSALILAAAMAGLAIGSKTALAQFAWDPHQTPLTPSGGSGTWDNTLLNWSNGSSDVAWNSTTANFGGPGGVVTIGAPITATGITLNAAGYTFSSSNPANILSLSSGSFVQAPGLSGVNEFAGPVNFSNSVVNLDSGTLKFSNTLTSAANSITNTTFNVASGSTLEFGAVTGAGALGNGSIVLNGGTLQIDPTANGVAGSYNSHFVLNGSSTTNGLDYAAASLPGSPSVMSGVINFNPNFLPPAPFYPGGPTINFGARFTGAINISSAGLYTFTTTSDDGSRLFIDNKLVVLDDGPKNALTLSSAPLTLSAGLHEFRLDYFQQAGNSSLTLNYSGPDTGNSSIVVPASAMQTLDPISMGNNVSVTQNSTIALSGSNFTQVGMGKLSFNPISNNATLTVTGDSGRSLHLSGTSMVSGSTNTINTSADVFAGQLSTTGNATLIKSGTGRVIFDYTASTSNVGSGTFIDIKQGTADVVSGGSSLTGTSDPVGAATLEIDGGTLAIDSKVNTVTLNNPVVVTSAGGTLESIEMTFNFLRGSFQLNGNLNIATASGNFPTPLSEVGLPTITGNGAITKVASDFTGDKYNLGQVVFGSSSPNWTGGVTLNANAGTIEGDFSNITDKPFGTNQVILHGGNVSLQRKGSLIGATYTPGNDFVADGDFTITTGSGSSEDFSTYQFGSLLLTGNRSITQSGDPSTGLAFNSALLGGNTTLSVGTSFGLGSITESTPSSLTITGAGTLTVSGPSSYTGGTNLTSGTVRLAGTNALPATGVVNISDATLDLNGYSPSILHLNSATALPIVGGLITNSASGTSMLFLRGDSTFNGEISDGGPGKAVALTVGGGKVSLSGINTFSGGVTINPGATLASALTYGNSGTLGSGKVQLAGGTLALQGQQQVSAASRQQGLQAQFYSYAVPSGNSNPNFNNLTTLTNHLSSLAPVVTVQSTAGGKDNFDFTNATVSNGTVTGTFTTQAPFNTPPSASNDTTASYGFPLTADYEVRFSGYIDVPQAGTATFSLTSDDGSMLWLDNNDTPVISNNALQPATTRSNFYTFATPGLHPITIAYFQAAGFQGLQAAWTPPGASAAHTLLNSETATGNLVTAPVQTYANNLVVSSDSSIDVSNSLAAVMGNLSIGSNQLSLTSSDMSGAAYGLTLANITLTGSPTFNVASSAGHGAGSLVLGPITNAGGFNVTKTGAGTLVLTGNNSSSGLTTVQAGLLDVEGSIHTSGVSVQGGAVLGGKGTVLEGVVEIHSNAALSPSLGSTTPIGGPFTIHGNLYLDDSTSQLVLDLAGVTPGSGYDQLQFGANVNLGGATLVLNDSTETQALPAVQRYWILDGLPGSSAVNGLLSYQGQLLADGSTFTDSAGQQFMIDYNAAGDPNGTGNDILLSTTPEPTGLGLLLASGVGLLLRRRRAREVG